LVVPFLRRFDEAQQDKGLVAKLKNELEGILALTTNALAELLRRGQFIVPEDVQKATDQWRHEGDQVAVFVEEECEAKPEGRTESRALYAAYVMWGRAAGVRNTLGRREFMNRVKALGFELAKGTAGIRIVQGLSCASAITQAMELLEDYGVRYQTQLDDEFGDL
jgi:putative DNA primase/helicase